ncbi:MAG: BON domain-containing protein [Halioglobus sp.]|nr:BON domain-containing protein [Halioglobus sp.]
MRIIFTSLLACCLLALSGCGSLLSSMQVGSIDDPPNKRTLGRMIEDDNIETKAMVNIHASNDAYENAHLVVVSYNGYVLLAGQVGDKSLKSRATSVVRKIQNVRRIYNELEVGPPISNLTSGKDSWVTSKIKSVLLTSDNIESSQIKVVTENSVVYLMGLVTEKEAKHVKELAADVSGVSKVVSLFEIIS